MAKKKNGQENELIEVETIPERFKEPLTIANSIYASDEHDKTLYHTKALLNQSQEPKFEGYRYFGCGDAGFYYVKS